ncbi:MAG: MAG4270 family putative restriction endonuclease [Metamycoplasmataceae bacterium]
MEDIKQIVNYIFDKFNNIDKDHKIKPFLWNIDTSLETIINCFIKNLRNNNIEIINKFEIKRTGINSKNNPLYKLFINDIDITPTSKKSKEVSASAMRQYLQVFSAFGWIVERVDLKKIIDNKNIKASASINKILLDDFDIKINYLELISKGSYSLVYYTRNLAYSFFVAYCYKNDFIPENIEFEKIKNKNGTKVFHSTDLENTSKYILGQKLEKKDEGNLMQTYGKSIKFLEKSSFEENIIYIYQSIKSFFEDDKERQEVIKEIERWNLQSNCSKKRGNLRKKIIEQRVKDQTSHSDIEDINQIEKLEQDIKSLDAAHIFEIKKIRTEIIKNTDNKEKINELLNDCDDPNNGILLPKTYHFYFDRGVIEFDINGNMLFNEEYIETLKKEKLILCRIKREYFNEKMQNYLIKRY